MKISFFLDNNYKQNIDFSNPSKTGNVGMGGTEYMIWTVAYYLQLIYKELEIIILAPHTEKLPENTKNLKCKNIQETVRIAGLIESDYLVLRTDTKNRKEYFDAISHSNIRIITWSHNFEHLDFIDFAKECKNIIYNVCVSKEQKDRLMDHDIYMKSQFIYNGLDFSLYELNSRNEKKENIVCYCGAPTAYKGFEKVLEIWIEIEKKIPDANLYVIGSAKLYNDNQKLGRYGIAESAFERRIEPYITENGKLKSNIVFFGNCAHSEKVKIIKKAKVGIVNPIPHDETFCITAVEFQALGIPVVGGYTFGLLNSIKNKETGFLCKTNTEIRNYVVKLLTDEKLNASLSDNAVRYVRRNFDIYHICEDWYRLFSGNLLSDQDRNNDSYSKELFVLGKFKRRINKFLRYRLGLKFIPSTLEFSSYRDNNYISQKLYSLLKKP